MVAVLAAMAMRVATESSEAKHAREEVVKQMDLLAQPPNPSMDDWGYGGDISGLGIAPLSKQKDGGDDS
jgi:hypothetical protein